MSDILVENYNVNDEEYIFLGFLVKEHSAVNAGQAIAEIETSKTVIEIVTPIPGIISFSVLPEQSVKVGDILCSVSVDSEGEIAAEKVAEVAPNDTPEKPSIPISTNKDSQVTKGFHTTRPYKQTSPTTENFLQNRCITSDVIIYGAGGHGKTICETLSDSGLKVAGFIDSNKALENKVYRGVKVIGGNEALGSLLKSGLTVCFIGVGGAISSDIRIAAYDMLAKTGFYLPPLIAKDSNVSSTAEIGEGTVVLPGATIGPDVVIGKNCIINNNVTVCHDTIIGDHVHLTPNAVIAGDCEIGDGTVIGMCATVLNATRVGKSCLVHNNVSVTKHLSDGTVLKG
jgi:sugar O-acyltransferase (sialic acid O-acetyltransferase NeuD family)